MDAVALEEHLGRWAGVVLDRMRPALGEVPVTWGGSALDGQTLRGAPTRGAPGAHLLSAGAQRLGSVLGQVAVAAGGEVAAATELVAGLVLTGRVVTVAAGLAQAALAEAIIKRGGAYLMTITATQPTGQEELVTRVDDPTAAVAVAETTDVHGGRVEQRRRMTSTDLTGDTEWPGRQQGRCLDRTVTDKRPGAVRSARAYAVTSLDPERAPAADLLTLGREHWPRENQVHYVRDVTFDEDRAGARGGSAPHLLAALRNAAIGGARAGGASTIADATRRFAAQPALALAAVGLPVDFE